MSPGSELIYQSADNKQVGIEHKKYTAKDFALFLIFHYLRRIYKYSAQILLYF